LFAHFGVAVRSEQQQDVVGVVRLETGWVLFNTQPYLLDALLPHFPHQIPVPLHHYFVVDLVNEFRYCVHPGSSVLHIRLEFLHFALFLLFLKNYFGFIVFDDVVEV